MAQRYFIGTSGFNYTEWRGKFYPADVPQKGWLNYYAGQFNSVEINNTFYGLPNPTAVKVWHDQTPDDFTFAVKMSRYVSHMKHLHMDDQGRDALARFFTAITPLESKLGVVLTQLPASFKRNDAVLREYLEAMVQSTDAKLAMEFRHESWFCDEVFAILRKYNTANVWNSAPADRMAMSLEQTADFVYARLHGTPFLYYSKYSDADLAEWATRIKPARQAYVYFDNTARVHAIDNAFALAATLSMKE